VSTNSIAFSMISPPQAGDHPPIPFIADNDPLLTVHEFALHLRIDDSTARNWVKRGLVEAVILPHKGKRWGYLFKTSTLNAIINPQSFDSSQC
jgi:hypothetical protein